MHPRKMRIERQNTPWIRCIATWVSRCILAKWGLKGISDRCLVFPHIVSRCILAKWGLKGKNREEIIQYLLFQDASSQNEDWKFAFFADSLSLSTVSRCILAKWGLKDTFYICINKVINSFKMHPRKMRIESSTGRIPPTSKYVVSRCILAKWGLKESSIIFIYNNFHCFKMHPRKMRIESQVHSP